MTALPIAQFAVQFRVARLAKTHQIALPVVAAFRDWNDVVYLLHGSKFAFLKAHFAEGMRRGITVADSFPTPAVFLVNVRGTFIFIVFLPCLFAVLLTVLSVCEPGATGV